LAFTVLLGGSLLAGGCFASNPYLGDDEGGPTSNPSLFGPNDDQLSTPYALGTHVHIEGHLADTGWAIASDDPTVLQCGTARPDDKLIGVDCIAMKEGAAHVLMRDAKQNVIRSQTVAVKAPDGAKIFSHGPVRLLGHDATVVDGMQTLDARVLTGGTGVFAVAYFQGQERLFGHGIAQLPTIPGVTIENKTSSGGPSNEWIFVTPSVDGMYPIVVSRAGAMLASLLVTAVPESEVTSVALNKEVGDKNDNDSVWVLGEGRNSAGQAVLGVMSGWSLDGVPQVRDDKTQRAGDLYRYRNAASGPQRTLIATHAGLSATIEVPAKDGNVFDTTYLGCTAAPGAPTQSGTALLVLALVALLLVARATRARTVAVRSA
jgi:hypothetical protein